MLLCFQSTCRKCFTYTHQTLRMAAQKDLTANTKSSRKSSKVNNFTPSFDTFLTCRWICSGFSLRYWMPAMNPLTLSSEQSGIIIALFQASGSDKGGWGEFCPPADEPLWVWFTERDEILSRKSTFIGPRLYEVWAYDDKLLHGNLCSREGILYNSAKLISYEVTWLSISMLAGKI